MISLLNALYYGICQGFWQSRWIASIGFPHTPLAYVLIYPLKEICKSNEAYLLSQSHFYFLLWHFFNCSLILPITIHFAGYFTMKTTSSRLMIWVALQCNHQVTFLCIKVLLVIYWHFHHTAYSFIRSLGASWMTAGILVWLLDLEQLSIWHCSFLPVCLLGLEQLSIWHCSLLLASNSRTHPVSPTAIERKFPQLSFGGPCIPSLPASPSSPLCLLVHLFWLLFEPHLSFLSIIFILF